MILRSLIAHLRWDEQGLKGSDFHRETDITLLHWKENKRKRREKCEIMHSAECNNARECMINERILNSVEEQKDLGDCPCGFLKIGGYQKLVCDI